MRVSPAGTGGKGETTILTFLIADIRGYSTFTWERGDAEAARLAKKFADLPGGRSQSDPSRVEPLPSRTAVLEDLPGGAMTETFA